MRGSLLSCALLVAIACGCSTGGDGAQKPPSPKLPEAATIVFETRGAVPKRVLSVREDKAEPTLLSVSGVDTIFGGTLPDNRVLLVERAAGGLVASLASVNVGGADGDERASLGSLPPERYRGLAAAMASGDAVIVELSRADVEGADVLALERDKAPRILAEGATLVAASPGYAAVMRGGDLVSVPLLEGAGEIALGGGDGLDKVADVREGRVLFTIHAGAGGDVRVAAIDGSSAITIGDPTRDEVAFALTPEGRVIFSRALDEGRVLMVARDGEERALTDAADDARPLALAPNEEIFASSAGGALFAVPVAGGPLRVLDAAAGKQLRIGGVTAGRVIYVGDTPQWPALRAARLDGTGVTTLCDKVPWLPFYGGTTPDGRVIFYRSLAGQHEGGRVFSVALDGSDMRPLALSASGADGEAIAFQPTDQDFETITPRGLVLVESEFAELGNEAQLLLAGADGAGARELVGMKGLRFVALLP